MTRIVWDDFIGSKVGGGYIVRSLIGSTDRSAVYQTFYGEERAALKLVCKDKEVPTVSQVEHPQIISLYASGDCVAGGQPFRYFVMEAADENLGTVIAARALTPDETREMLGPVLEALCNLHEQGLAHGHIRPSNILAHADSVKLSCDSIRPTGAVASPEEDMRALGLTIIEVLTRERQASGIAAVPQPLRDIVEHSLEPVVDARWTARQAAMRLSGVVPPSATEPAIASASPPARVGTSMGSATGKRLVPFWVLPAAAIVMLVAVVFVLIRGTGSSSDSSFAASAPAASPPTANSPGASPATASVPNGGVPSGGTAQIVPKPTPFDAAPRPVVKPAAKPAASVPAAKPSGSGWFVVVASYAREVDAAQEAGVLTRKFPHFKASVFPPSPIDTHYLVIIGSGLSEAGAESLRERAVSSGLPGDTYIKRYPTPHS